MQGTTPGPVAEGWIERNGFLVALLAALSPVALLLAALSHGRQPLGLVRVRVMHDRGR